MGLLKNILDAISTNWLLVIITCFSYLVSIFSNAFQMAGDTGKPLDGTFKKSIGKMFIVIAVILTAVLILKIVDEIKSGASGNNGPAGEKVSIPSDAVTFGGHSYLLYTPDSETWDGVLRKCAANGGYPVVINSSKENEFLFNYMTDCGIDEAFIGYTDLDEENHWKWVYGMQSDFEDWGINSRGQHQPNHENRNEDWAQLNTRMREGHWNDSQYGSGTYAYFCEWDTAKSGLFNIFK